MKQNERPGFPKFRPRPGGDDNNPRKGPKFSIYWVWGIIALILFGYNFFGAAFSADARKLDSEMEFRNNMLDKGDVARLVLVTNKNLVRVYIKKDSLDKPYYTVTLVMSYQVV
jgi:AFG3 family protein